MNDQPKEKLLHCSFCGKSQMEVSKLIAGPDVFICDECAGLCREIITDENRKQLKDNAGQERQCSFCGKYEEEAKKIISGPHGAICDECISISDEIIGEEDEAAGIRIRRSIEFAPEHKQAGIAILSYFSRVIEQKYPDENVSVKIEQDGNAVTMIVQTAKGSAELIRQALDDYGKVVMGAASPAVLFSNPLQELELKSKLEMTALELRLTKELHATSMQLQDQRVNALEERVKELHSFIGSGLSQTKDLHKLIGSLITAKSDSVAAIKAMNKLIEGLKNGIGEDNENQIKDALNGIAANDPSLFDHVVDVLKQTFGGTSGNLLASWIASIAVSLPK